MKTHFPIGIVFIISLQWVIQVGSLPLFEEVNFKRNFEFNFKPIQFKPIEFAIEKITPFKQFSFKHVIGKRNADEGPSMDHMLRYPYEVYEDDLEPSPSEYEPFLPPLAKSTVTPKTEEKPKEEKPPLMHTDIGKSEPIGEFLQSAQFEKEIEKELVLPIVPKVPPVEKPIVPIPPIIKPGPELEKPKVIQLEKGPVGLVPPLINPLLLKPEVPAKPEEKEVIVELKPIPLLVPPVPVVPEQPHPIEAKPIIPPEPLPPVEPKPIEPEPKPVEKPEPEPPKPPPPTESPNPLLRGSRLALYFGNILLEVLSQVLISARTSLTQFTSPLATM